MTRTQPLIVRSTALLAALCVATACADRVPTSHVASPETRQDLRPSTPALESTSLTMGWLPVLGSATASTPHDPNRLPTVTICRWSNDACVGAPIATMSIGNGLTASATGFAGQWALAAASMPLTRTTFRIAVSHDGVAVGLPVLVDAMRGRWALTVPGQSPTLIAANLLPLAFRLGAASTAAPPLTVVSEGVQSAASQFFPLQSNGGETRTAQQLATLTTLANTLGDLQTALSGPPEAAALAVARALSAADAAFKVASAGDQAELDVIRLELESAGRLFGMSG